MNGERVLAGPSRPKTMRKSDFRPTACEARALQDASSTSLEKAGILRPLDAGFTGSAYRTAHWCYRCNPARQTLRKRAATASHQRAASRRHGRARKTARAGHVPQNEGRV